MSERSDFIGVGTTDEISKTIVRRHCGFSQLRAILEYLIILAPKPTCSYVLTVIQ